MDSCNRLEVILKTIERCNINCSYCYFFNRIDQSYKKHPKYISTVTIENIVDFLKKGCKELRVKHLQIDLHGGEPLMQKKNAFNEMCYAFRNSLESVTNLSICVQTNGTLIDEEWIELFSHHQIQVGVSLDGPEEFNDLARIDHQGHGTHTRTVAGIKLLIEAANKGLIYDPAILCVINPKFDPVAVYRHFVDDLKVLYIDFLFPDLTHDAFQTQYAENKISPDAYGDFLIDVFEEWTRDDNPNIYIRILNSSMEMLLGGQSAIRGFGTTSKSSDLAFTIASNGDLAPEDTYRSIDPTLMNLNVNVSNTKLSEFVKHPILQEVEQQLFILPTNCNACQWKNICGGGSLIHRFKNEIGFNNPSVLCGALQKLYAHVHNFLMRNNSA